jgi:uncharacterized protein YbjQ (UPF0145 family)
MIITTTNTVEGRTIRDYKGLVTGEAIIGAHVFKDLFAGLRDIVGGRSDAYEKTIREARETAVHEMQQEAEQLGGNCIVGIDIDYEVVGQGGSMMMVSVTGTAVVLG